MEMTHHYRTLPQYLKPDKRVCQHAYDHHIRFGLLSFFAIHPASLFFHLFFHYTIMSVDTFNRFLATTTGREKACRLVQYFARFYAFYLFRSGAPKEAIQRWNDLKSHIGNARKFFRLFKQVEFANTAVKSLSIQDEVVRATSVLKQIGMFFYYGTEALVLVSRMRIKVMGISSILTQHYIIGQCCQVL